MEKAHRMNFINYEFLTGTGVSLKRNKFVNLLKNPSAVQQNEQFFAKIRSRCPPR